MQPIQTRDPWDYILSRAVPAFQAGRLQVRSYWNIRAHKDGRLLVPELVAAANITHDDGEEFIAKLFSEEVTVPANWYIGLDNRTTLAEADNLASIAATEPSTGGYARQAVASDAVDLTVAQDGGTSDYQFTTKTVNFAASGADFTEVRNAFFTNQLSAQTGKYLLFSRALSAPVTITNGSDIDVSMIVRFREAA